MKKKKYLRIPLLMALASLAAIGFSSCSKSDAPDEETAKDTELSAVAQQYIDGTVNSTYKLLADNSDKLYEGLVGLKASVKAGTATDAQMQEVCKLWKLARTYYESSEAFLFGAATDFGIDPHIDTWPLDLDGLKVALKNTNQLAAMDADDGDEYAGNKLGPELLGFHGIEYILFRDGNPRTASDLMGNDAGLDNLSGYNEMVYSVAVAGDLRNKCFQLEVSWNADAPKAHVDKVESLEWPYTVNGGILSYAENFLKSGQAGSTYATWRMAMSAILIGGCQNISDEVGNTKMSKPYSGEDKNYIESPYSQNSLTDFADNIRSIQNSYMGGRPESRNETKSIHSYLQKYNPTLDTKVVNSINNAIAKIQACPTPFVKNYTNPAVQTAITACSALSAVLVEANDYILKN